MTDPHDSSTLHNRREIPISTLINEVFYKRLADLRIKANEVRKKNREAHVSKILEITRLGSVTNREITATLNISRATAAIYLSILVKKGFLTRVGRGRSTQYILVL